MKCCDCDWERVSNGCGCVWPCKKDENGIWVKIPCEIDVQNKKIILKDE